MGMSQNRSLVPFDSTVCVWMTFGLRCSQPARRPQQASLPVRVPTVESLLHASFDFTSRLRLALRYGCRHRLRLAPFIQQDSAHAGHTGAGFSLRRTSVRLPRVTNRRGSRAQARRRLKSASHLNQASPGQRPAVHLALKSHPTLPQPRHFGIPRVRIS